jgi:hypothetical protein
MVQKVSVENVIPYVLHILGIIIIVNYGSGQFCNIRPDFWFLSESFVFQIVIQKFKDQDI